MTRLTTLKAVKKTLTISVFVAALTALIGFRASGVAAQGQPLWSIVAHFQYEDGFELDYVVQQGVSTADVGAVLAECGRSHWTGTVVRYHCYPVPE
jgi:hypothetical protein